MSISSPGSRLLNHTRKYCLSAYKRLLPNLGRKFLDTARSQGLAFSLRAATVWGRPSQQPNDTPPERRPVDSHEHSVGNLLMRGTQGLFS